MQCRSERVKRKMKEAVGADMLHLKTDVAREYGMGATALRNIIERETQESKVQRINADYGRNKKKLFQYCQEIRKALVSLEPTSKPSVIRLCKEVALRSCFHLSWVCGTFHKTADKGLLQVHSLHIYNHLAFWVLEGGDVESLKTQVSNNLDVIESFCSGVCQIRLDADPTIEGDHNG